MEPTVSVLPPTAGSALDAPIFGPVSVAEWEALISESAENLPDAIQTAAEVQP